MKPKTLAALTLVLSLCAAPSATVDPIRKTNNLIVVNYDPTLREHGGTNLQKFMRWNNPRSMTTNSSPRCESSRSRHLTRKCGE